MTRGGARWFENPEKRRFFSLRNRRLTHCRARWVARNRKKGYADAGKNAKEVAHMILADKIIALRKKNGWSQEELAEKMHVTRQSVSKWEGALSVPDLDKILQLARLFEVSTDYLLKDEIEQEDGTAGERTDAPARRVTMEEANEFLSVRAKAAGRIAVATLLCILSPICLIVLGGAAETGVFGISEEMAGLIGLVVLLLMITPAVAAFILTGIRSQKFEYLETEPVEPEYGVVGMVQERQKQYRDTYARGNILGTCICILSVIPLFVGALLPGTGENEFYAVLGLAATMLLAGIGAMCFILVGVRWASMQKLLQEGEYTLDAKKTQKGLSAFSTVYWLLVTAGYLAYSLPTENWKESWIVWPVAGVAYAAIATIWAAILKRKSE